MQIGLWVTLLLTCAPFDRTAIDRAVKDSMAGWGVPGVAIAIVSRDQALHLAGYGHREAGRDEPVTPDTLFPLASCSKAFTTALAGQLASQRKLNWDGPVRDYVPNFHLADPSADALVSLRDLAAHRTGVGPHDLLWYRAPYPQADLVRRVGKVPLSRPFRTEMQYQSIMYIALGQAVSKAGGKAWETLMAERLFEPLGMKGAVLTTKELEKHTDRSAGHREVDGKITAIPWYPQPEPNPAGSVAASARDLVPWLHLQLNGGRVGDRVIVPEAFLRETQSPQIVIRMGPGERALQPETRQMSYGLGWVVQDYRGHLVVQHAGLIDGFRVHLTVLPDDGYAFAILANRESTRMNLALSNSIIDRLLGLSAKDWDKTIRAALDAEADARKAALRRDQLARRPDLRPSVPQRELAGTYDNPAYGEAKIAVRDGELVWQWAGWKLPLEHHGRDSFRVRWNDDRLGGAEGRFDVVDGTVKAFHLLGIEFQRR